MSKERVTLWLEEETIEMLDGAVEEASRDPEIGDEVSRGMLARHLINLGVDEWDGTVRDLLPEALLRKYRIKWRKKRRKDRDYENKIAAYWRQNVQRELTKFYDDEAPARPSRVRDSMEEWRAEAEDVKDDEELREDLAWLDRKLDEYEEAVEFTNLVPDRGFERVSPEVETGADLRQLSREPLDLVRDVEALSEGNAMDADAMRERLAGDYGVSTDAIDEFLDLLVRDDVDVRRALKGNHEGEAFRDVVDARALGEGSPLTDLDGEAEATVAETEDAPELPDGRDRGDDDRPDADLVAEAADRLDGATYTDPDAIATALASEYDVEEGVAEAAVEEAVDADDSEVVEATPDGGDRAGGLAPEDLAPEEAIETAVDVIEAGEDPGRSVDLRRVTSTENQRKAAVAAARERLADGDAATDGGTADATVATDGGEAGD